MVATTSSPDVSIGYEVANALGRLNADRPRLGARCTEVVEYARTVRWVLNALDLYHRKSGATYADIARLIRRGDIELRFSGSTMVVSTP